MRLLPRLTLIPLLTLLPPARLWADTVAISSVVFNGYARNQQPDGKFKPEFYIFGEGGCWTRPIADAAMDRLTFAKIARIVAAPLAQQNYRPAPTTADASLLILVFWGSTEGTRDTRNLTGAIDRLGSASSAYSAARSVDQASRANPGQVDPATAAAESAYDAALELMQLDNAVRDRIDTQNARILGYTESLDRARFARHMSFAQDTLDEVGDNRYYVVLQAYDYKTAKQERKLKPLWTSRISVSEQGDFAQALERMVWSAARTFGRETDGLQRKRLKEGSVDLAPLQVIEVVPNAK